MIWAIRLTGLGLTALAVAACASGGGALSNVIVEPRLQERLAQGAEPPLALGTLLGPFAGTEVGDTLTAADQRIAVDAVLPGLATAVVGDVTEWTNPASGHSGTFTPVATYASEDGLTCRDYELTVAAGGQTGNDRGAACLEQDGTWWTVVLPIRSSTRRGLRR